LTWRGGNKSSVFRKVDSERQRGGTRRNAGGVSRHSGIGHSKKKKGAEKTLGEDGEQASAIVRKRAGRKVAARRDKKGRQEKKNGHGREKDKKRSVLGNCYIQKDESPFHQSKRKGHPQAYRSIGKTGKRLGACVKKGEGPPVKEGIKKLNKKGKDFETAKSVKTALQRA